MFVVEDEGGGHGQRLVGLQETDAQPALHPGLDDGGNGNHELSETCKHDSYLTDRAPKLMDVRNVEQKNSRSGRRSIYEDPV